MEKEDLKETKIYLSNVEDRVKFQKKVFNLGVEWCESGKSVANTEHMFYYIDSDLRLSHTDIFDKLSFIGDNRKQIFLDEVLAIEEPKEVCEFNTFDKVLVRDTNTGLWGAKLFSHYNYKDDSFPYVTTNNSSYSQCIKYEGNEHLLMTSDSE